jgi:hypothetical protein
VNIGSVPDESEIKEFSEIIDTSFIQRELRHGLRSIDLVIWLLRFAACAIAILTTYIILNGYREVRPLLGSGIAIFGLILVLVYSEVSLQVIKRSATPMSIRSGRLWVRPSSMERLRGWDGNIDVKNISVVRETTNQKPHAPLGGTFFLYKMSPEASELQIVLKKGDSRWTGPKPRETINQVVNILTEDYGVRVA